MSRVHRVRSGDTLCSIARGHGCDLASLVAENPLLGDNPDLLECDMTVCLPARARSCCSRTASTSRYAGASMSLAAFAFTPPSVRAAVRSPSPPTSPARRRPSPTRPAAQSARSPSMAAVAKPVRAAASSSRDVRLWRWPLAPKPLQHTVVQGESLSTIALQHKMSVLDLRQLNNMHNSDMLQVGSKLVLRKSPQRSPPAAPAKVRSKAKKHVETKAERTVEVQAGDSLASLASKHGVTMRGIQKLNRMQDDHITAGTSLRVPPRECAPSPEGKERELGRGFRRTRLRRLKVAGPVASAARRKWMAKGLSEEQLHGKRSTWGRLPLYRHAPQARLSEKNAKTKRQFRCPVASADSYVSSGYGMRWGRFHEGIDLAAETGTAILAAHDGTVQYSDVNGSYGKLLCISHGAGFSTRYAHCDELEKSVGQTVRRGDRVATIGSTGRSSGPHLHFEVRLEGYSKDPYDYIEL